MCSGVNRTQVFWRTETHHLLDGGEINMSYNCLDRQVEEGYGDDVAVIHDSPLDGSIQRLTYKELLENVQRLAGVMSKRCGVGKGDRVLLYFPMIPQCLIAMLACTRIGAIYTAVYGGFAINEIALRIRYFEPKIVICSNIGLEPGEVVNYKDKIDRALELSGHTTEFCIVYNRPNYPPASLKEGKDLNWSSEMSNATPQGVTALESSHPMYVIFTSGTTGAPKGIVKFTGGAVVSNKYAMKRIFALRPGEVWWAMSDFSWIIGQTCSSYGPLLSRNPTILYEGKAIGTPDSSQIVRVLNTHKVVSLLTIPTIMKILRKSCTESELELTYGDLRMICLGGEITDQHIRQWTLRTFHCPVYNVWSQSELASVIISPALGFKGAEKYRLDDSIGLVAPSFQIKIVDRNSGDSVPSQTIGRILIKLPINPTSVFSLYKDHDRCIRTYFTNYHGYYDTMDAGMINEDGLLKIVARDDDIINVGAVRICGGAVEEACIGTGYFNDVAVVALEDTVKGHVPFALLIRKENGQCSDSHIINVAIKNVADVIGEIANFSKAVIVPGLPKTKTGKILRTSLADMINGKSFQIPQTVENPDIYGSIHDILIREGYKALLPSMQ